MYGLGRSFSTKGRLFKRGRISIGSKAEFYGGVLPDPKGDASQNVCERFRERGLKGLPGTSVVRHPFAVRVPRRPLQKFPLEGVGFVDRNEHLVGRVEREVGR